MWLQKVSETGRARIKQLEGFRAEPMRALNGAWVFGYGHRSLARPSRPVTPDEAEQLLERDLAPISRFLSSSVRVPINQAQFDGLAAFAFAIGQSRFEATPILAAVNAGNFERAAQAIRNWRDEAPAPDVEKRRAVEAALLHPASVLLLSEKAHDEAAPERPARRVPKGLRTRPPAPGEQLGWVALLGLGVALIGSGAWISMTGTGAAEDILLAVAMGLPGAALCARAVLGLRRSAGAD